MNLLTCILTENECYAAKKTIKPQGVMVHSTGANNPNLKRYVQPVASTPDRDALLAQLGKNTYGNHWNVYHPGGKNVGPHTFKRDENGKCAVCGGVQKCVHGFIGKLADGSVAAVQTLPWAARGWHAGSGSKGSANNTHIAFEICEDGLTDRAYFDKVYREAVELTAYLCRQYELDPLADGVVICHSEGHKRGIASNHGDVMYWFTKHGKSMDDFRADVAAELATKPDPEPEKEDGMKYYEKLNDVPASYRPTIRKLLERGAMVGYSDPDPSSIEDNVINVSEDFCRIVTMLDKMGKLD